MEILKAAIIGVIATALADLWQQLLKRGAGLPIANWKLIGRWVAGMPRGVFVHRPMTNAAPVPGEAAIGWTFHYLVGITYAVLYLALVRTSPKVDPGLADALALGVVTLAAPWLVMQPALGFGIMVRRLPNRVAVTVVTANTHLVFGFGIYVGVLVVALLSGVLRPALAGSDPVISPHAVTDGEYYDSGAPPTPKIELGRVLYVDRIVCRRCRCRRSPGRAGRRLESAGGQRYLRATIPRLIAPDTPMYSNRRSHDGQLVDFA